MIDWLQRHLVLLFSDVTSWHIKIHKSEINGLEKKKNNTSAYMKTTGTA